MGGFKLLQTHSYSLLYAGLKQPTPIQTSCIPQILNGADCIGAAKTG